MSYVHTCVCMMYRARGVAAEWNGNSFIEPIMLFRYFSSMFPSIPKGNEDRNFHVYHPQCSLVRVRLV